MSNIFLFKNICLFYKIIDNTHYIITMKDKELLNLLKKNGWPLKKPLTVTLKAVLKKTNRISKNTVFHLSRF